MSSAINYLHELLELFGLFLPGSGYEFRGPACHSVGDLPGG